MVSERIGFAQLLGISACLALSLIAHATTLPPWVFGIIAVCGAIRLLSARRGGGPPPKVVLLLAAALAIPLLFVRFHTFNGLAAGTALLALMAGLKLLESSTKRDMYIITLIIYFVSISALLEADSFWLLAYLIGVCWLTTATLLRVTSSGAPPEWQRSLRYAGRILGQALPLALVFWLLFPRFAAPLWQMPADQQTAGSGLSDTMSPGDINELALSEDVAFRVHFASAVPPLHERYWRGPVLNDFDGRNWKRSYPQHLGAPAVHTQGVAYRYTVNLEPHQHNWIFALDWPSTWDLPRAALTSDFTLVQQFPVSRPIDVAATSYTHVQFTEPLSAVMRTRNTLFPKSQNPRTQQLARQLRSEHPDDMDLVRAVLDMFTTQPFYYTLQPPKLAENSVDAFLFDSRRGFCGHYASAFALLMRAAGIPTRVVTGYQGGTFNPYADYWILRQSDAHAWDEVWIEGRGWLRVDPTAAIAPSRVEHTVNDAGSSDEPLDNRWQRRTPWLVSARFRLDALREMWRERILNFDQRSQDHLLEMLHIPEPDGQKLVVLLAAALGLVLLWLTWQVRRELQPAARDPLAKAYLSLCRKLALAGLPRLPHQGPEDYAAKVATLRPDLANAVTALCRRYSTLRYGAPQARAGIAQFAAAVRAFKITPRGSRGSS